MKKLSIQENILKHGKNKKSLRHWNHSPLIFFLFPVQLEANSTSDRYIKEHRGATPLAPSCRAMVSSYWEGQGISIFIYAPSYLLGSLSSKQVAAERQVFPYSAQPWFEG